MENIIIEFGSWAVTSDGVERTLQPTYTVGAFDLWKVRNDGNMLYWDWMLHMTDKTWMTKEELQDFTLALLFAQDYFKQSHKAYANKDINLCQTLYVQQQLKANHDRVREVESTQSGYTFPPDEKTKEHRRKVNDVIIPVVDLELNK